jgi:hypothetical protein
LFVLFVWCSFTQYNNSPLQIVNGDDLSSIESTPSIVASSESGGGGDSHARKRSELATAASTARVFTPLAERLADEPAVEAARDGVATVLRGVAAQLVTTLRVSLADGVARSLALQAAATRLAQHLFNVARASLGVASSIGAKLTLAATRECVVTQLVALLDSDVESARQLALRWLHALCDDTTQLDALLGRPGAPTSSVARLAAACGHATLAASGDVRRDVALVLLRLARRGLLRGAPAHHVAACAAARLRDCEPHVRDTYEQLLCVIGPALLDNSASHYNGNSNDDVAARHALWRRLLMAGNVSMMYDTVVAYTIFTTKLRHWIERLARDKRRWHWPIRRAGHVSSAIVARLVSLPELSTYAWPHRSARNRIIFLFCSLSI